MCWRIFLPIFFTQIFYTLSRKPLSSTANSTILFPRTKQQILSEVFSFTHMPENVWPGKRQDCHSFPEGGRDLVLGRWWGRPRLGLSFQSGRNHIKLAPLQDTNIYCWMCRYHLGWLMVLSFADNLLLEHWDLLHY